MKLKASIQEETDHTPKRGMLIITGDWNAKAGNKGDSSADGKLGLGVRNEATTGLWTSAKSTTCPSQAHASNNQMMYVWISPDGHHRNQRNYVTGSRRYRSLILSTETRPRADCSADHALLISNLSIKLRSALKKNLSAKI